MKRKSQLSGSLEDNISMILLDVLSGIGDLNEMIEEEELLIALKDCTSVALNDQGNRLFKIYTSFLILGEGYKEIAENMQIPEGSIGTTISRFRKN